MEKKKPTTIAVFDAVEAALTDLRGRFKGRVYDVSTGKGMSVALKDRAELRGLRTSLEKHRSAEKKPVLELGRLIDSEAKRITAELVELEEPIAATIKAEEDRKAAIKAEKERIERERIDGIDLAIGTMKVLPAKATGRSSHDIRMLMVTLIDTVVDDSFGEFQEEATTTKALIMATLQEMHTAKAADEEESKRLEVERKELEEKKAGQDELEARRQAAIAVEKAKLDEERQKVEDDKKALEVEREAAEKTKETEPINTDKIIDGHEQTQDKKGQMTWRRWKKLDQHFGYPQPLVGADERPILEVYPGYFDGERFPTDRHALLAIKRVVDSSLDGYIVDLFVEYIVNVQLAEDSDD